MYIGLAEGNSLKTHFQVIHFSYVPGAYAYMSGLLEIFKSKLVSWQFRTPGEKSLPKTFSENFKGPHLINPAPLIFISIRFTYLIQECVNNSLLDVVESADALELGDNDQVNFKDLCFGATHDVIE